MTTRSERGFLPGRVTLVAIVLGFLVAVPVVARSEADALLLSASDTVFQYERALHAEHVDAIRVNGLGFKIATGSTADAIGVVLDHFQSVCREENADLRTGMEMIVRRTKSRVPFDGTLRTEHDGRGAVACLGRGVVGRRLTLAARFHGFLANADIAAVGPVHLFFVYATSGRTTYIAVSSEGNLPLLAAFPRSADAPGRDPDGLPRPAATVRRLSAWAPGSSASVAVYETANAEPGAALAAYRNALTAAGFEVSERSERDGHILARHGARAVLASALCAVDGGALLTVVGL